jgi:DNA polymerase-3 subunit alpha
MDYADNRRDEVIEYARKKYGYDKVAQIGTFGTMAARGSVRDVTRALGFPYSLGDSIAKQIPMGAQGFPMTIERAMKENVDLKKMYDTEADVKKIIDMAKKIEGSARHISVHAAGVVISPTPLTDFVPLQYDTKGDQKIITQYDMNSVGEDGVGLLKFDFLGIRNLAILADAVKLAEKIEGIKIDIENVDVTDKKTFEMLARGETVGLFQLNGDGMTRWLKELKPTAIHDINVMVALYRPGPMDNIQEYIARKNGIKPVTYMNPKMKNFLDRTFGVLVYQDDLLMTAIEVAGYNWAEVDKFRKAVGKKILRYDRTNYRYKRC